MKGFWNQEEESSTEAPDELQPAPGQPSGPLIVERSQRIKYALSAPVIRVTSQIILGFMFVSLCALLMFSLKPEWFETATPEHTQSENTTEEESSLFDAAVRILDQNITEGEKLVQELKSAGLSGEAENLSSAIRNATTAKTSDSLKFVSAANKTLNTATRDGKLALKTQANKAESEKKAKEEAAKKAAEEAAKQAAEEPINQQPQPPTPTPDPTPTPSAPAPDPTPTPPVQGPGGSASSSASCKSAASVTFTASGEGTVTISGGGQSSSGNGSASITLQIGPDGGSVSVSATSSGAMYGISPASTCGG